MKGVLSHYYSLSGRGSNTENQWNAVVTNCGLWLCVPQHVQKWDALLRDESTRMSIHVYAVLIISTEVTLQGSTCHSLTVLLLKLQYTICIHTHAYTNTLCYNTYKSTHFTSNNIT